MTHEQTQSPNKANILSGGQTVISDSSGSSGFAKCDLIEFSWMGLWGLYWHSLFHHYMMLFSFFLFFQNIYIYCFTYDIASSELYFCNIETVKPCPICHSWNHSKTNDRMSDKTWIWAALLSVISLQRFPHCQSHPRINLRGWSLFFLRCVWKLVDSEKHSVAEWLLHQQIPFCPAQWGMKLFPLSVTKETWSQF